MERQKFKELQRQEYDNLVKRIQNSRISTSDENTLLSALASKLVFFYHPNKDIKRLVILFLLYYLYVAKLVVLIFIFFQTFLSQKMLSKQDQIVISSYNKINNWNYKLKKLLYFHLKLLTPGRDTFATPLRMIEVFTTDSVYMKHLKCDNVSEYLTDVRCS